ncbi:imm11 family protein [Pseudoduganella lutea]|uniref:Immunity MXAN-0049 protein domain-containing protein n=1 Tax=Pseudoduganella lutea TaxID=321985 RepID=A0A4P6L4X4_9BURK|nr:DUF1629 domain-containing protein [Pseudoduganella lutea]QBE65958.1 hypothetical protein EWM63_25685 [Pseudoduganella lutea]
MSDYDNEYFFIRSDDANECLPYLRPDGRTNGITFRNRALPQTTQPLVFTNALKDDFQRAGIKDEPADILFESSNFLVRSHLHERLLECGVPDMHSHPAVYIGDDGLSHEDYWFIGFTRRLDCWDRMRSTFDTPPATIGANDFYSVRRYALNASLFDVMPLRQRRLFQMGATQDAMVVCHKSLAAIFLGNGNSGAILQPVGDY